MAILEGDIKILASQVLDDVPEGGGAATGNEIVDGVSNNLFPDISELDRVFGRVNLRKVFVGVDTENTDSYFGAHVIVGKPPADPRVHATLFTTENAFDIRTAAQSRVESYLALGPTYQPYLFGNHIAGMMTVTLLGQLNAVLPVVGETLVLVKHGADGPTVTQQYLRVSSVSSAVKTFTDDQGDFQRLEITLGMTDALRLDYSGFEAQRRDTSLNFLNKGRMHTTVVADAARYYGIVPLSEAASMGDFGVQGESIFAPLVPSAQTETAITDARMNQRQIGVTALGGAISRQINGWFTTVNALFLGAGILPGSLSVGSAGATVFDRDGELILASDDSSVGTVDYANGALGLNSNVFGTGSQTFSVAYKIAAQPQVVSESFGRPVTAENRALTWVATLNPPPARGTLEIHYRAQGRWYVLAENGSGALRGSDAAYGAGQLNFDTGTVAVTLGALPDVDTQIIYVWARGAEVVINLPPVQLAGVDRLCKVIDLGRAILPGSVSITWSASGNRVSTDSAGFLGGDGRGTVDYGTGRIEFAPVQLPALVDGVQYTLQATLAATTNQSNQETTLNLVDSGAAWAFTLANTPIRPGSLRATIGISYPRREYPGTDGTGTASMYVHDDGAGNLVTFSNPAYGIVAGATVGTVDYTTGSVTIAKTASLTMPQGEWEHRVYSVTSGIGPAPSYVYKGESARTVTANILSAPLAGADAWSSTHAKDTPAEPYSNTFNLSELTFDVALRAGYTIADGTHFMIGSTRYMVLNGAIVTYPDPATGAYTEVGEIDGPTFRMTKYASGSGFAPTILNFFGVQAPPIAATPDTPLLVDSATFRTAIAPIKNGSLNISGQWADGTAFSVFSDEDGIIATGTAPANEASAGTRGVFGKVDYTTGVVEVRFGRLVGADYVTPVGGIDFSGRPNLPIPVLQTDGLQSQGVRADTLRYNAAAFSYIPLDADILGLDPVRLPSDGRVPIFRAGLVAVVHHTATTAPQTVVASGTIDCGRQRLSRVKVLGANGVTITDGYSVNLDSGIVTFDDVTGYSQPVRVEHRIEDAALVTDAQINGSLRFSRALTHNFPVGSYVSSALLIGDIKARASILFDQTSWTSVWSDERIGADLLAAYDAINNPVQLTNEGTITERWALQFTNSTTFNIVGEHLGLVGTGTTGTGAEPLNPVSMTPYFKMPAAGFGSGWGTGNVIRLNTVGARAPLWAARVVQQGPATEDDDSFTIIVRGDVDA